LEGLAQLGHALRLIPRRRILPLPYDAREPFLHFPNEVVVRRDDPMLALELHVPIECMHERLTIRTGGHELEAQRGPSERLGRVLHQLGQRLLVLVVEGAVRLVHGLREACDDQSGSVEDELQRRHALLAVDHVVLVDPAGHGFLRLVDDGAKEVSDPLGGGSTEVGLDKCGGDAPDIVPQWRPLHLLGPHVGPLEGWDHILLAPLEEVGRATGVGVHGSLGSRRRG